VQAPAPIKAIARGKASFATLAHVVVAKFDHHLPLYRQAEMMAAQGLDIDRRWQAGQHRPHICSTRSSVASEKKGSRQARSMSMTRPCRC